MLLQTIESGVEAEEGRVEEERREMPTGHALELLGGLMQRDLEDQQPEVRRGPPIRVDISQTPPSVTVQGFDCVNCNALVKTISCQSERGSCASSPCLESALARYGST